MGRGSGGNCNVLFLDLGGVFMVFFKYIIIFISFIILCVLGTFLHVLSSSINKVLK